MQRETFMTKILAEIVRRGCFLLIPTMEGSQEGSEEINFMYRASGKECCIACAIRGMIGSSKISCSGVLPLNAWDMRSQTTRLYCYGAHIDLELRHSHTSFSSPTTAQIANIS